MTLRRVILMVVIAFFCWMVAHAVDAGDAELVGALAWVVVVVLMLPMDRFNPDNIVRIMRLWKGKDHGDT